MQCGETWTHHINALHLSIKICNYFRAKIFVSVISTEWKILSCYATYFGQVSISPRTFHFIAFDRDWIYVENYRVAMNCQESLASCVLHWIWFCLNWSTSSFYSVSMLLCCCESIIQRDTMCFHRVFSYCIHIFMLLVDVSKQTSFEINTKWTAGNIYFFQQ